MPRLSLWTLTICVIWGSGCASLPRQPQAEDDSPNALLEWAVAKKKEKNGQSKEKEQDKPKNGEGDTDATKAKYAKDGGKADSSSDKAGESGDEDKKPRVADEPDKDKNGDDEKSDKDDDDTIKTDRPDFTEASSTVGKGRLQLETGYTFFQDRQTSGSAQSHSFPEMLVRIGMFADWFEWRLLFNYAMEDNVPTPGGRRTVSAGWEDLVVGCKIALTEQKKCLPESAIILELSVPTGSEEFSANEALPGVNFLCGWDIIENCLSLSTGTQFALNVGDPSTGLLGDEIVAPVFLPIDRHVYFTTAQSASVGYTLSEKLGAFTEFFAFFPQGAIEPNIVAEYYFDGGFTYKVTKNFQLDIRGGIGLNQHASDYFAGSGFAVRY